MGGVKAVKRHGFALRRGGGSGAPFVNGDAAERLALPCREEQVGEFETNGYTLVQSTLSPQELDDAEEAWHRLQQLRNGG